MLLNSSPCFAFNRPVRKCQPLFQCRCKPSQRSTICRSTSVTVKRVWRVVLLIWVSVEEVGKTKKNGWSFGTILAPNCHSILAPFFSVLVHEGLLQKLFALNRHDKHLSIGSRHGNQTLLGGEFQTFFIPPQPGEMFQFDEHIFPVGWFNHQLGCHF